MTPRITLQLVADQVGCSAKTVSNAFTRPDQLSAATRERVLAAAARLGYPGPNPLAAGLRRGRVGALGFAYANHLSYAFDDPVTVQLLAGIGSVAEDARTGLLLVPGSATADRNSSAVSAAVIDGLIVYSLADDDPLVAAAVTRRLPTVVIDQPDPRWLTRATDSPPAWIGIDDRAAARIAAGHLLALGHRDLGVVTFGLSRDLIGGLADEPAQAAATYSVSRHRLQGYRDAVVAAGLDWSRVPVMAATNSTIAEGAAGAAALLERPARPTAILCLSDRLAEGAMQAARVRGVDIPRDLSIVGFDDAPLAAELGLTTIRQPHRRKGELAAQALLDLINGRAPPPPQLLPTELVIRSSARPPRA